MTNIEFLVNELRKANETIANLRKENANVKAHNAELTHRIKNMEKARTPLGDLDALAMLKKKMEE